MEDLEKTKEGFNAGYLMARHDPTLSRQILKSLEGQEIPYAQGYMAGAREYAQERIKELIESRRQDQNLDQDRGLDR